MIRTFTSISRRIALLGALIAIAVGCGSSTTTTSTTTSTPPGSVAGTTPGTRPGTTQRPAGTTPGTVRGTTTLLPGPTVATAVLPPPPGASTTTTEPGAKPTTPEQFAQALFDAWKRNDRPAAEAVAERAAVDALFATPYVPVDTPDGPQDAYVLMQCTGSGTSVCRFSGQGEVLVMTVRAATPDQPMLVTTAKFLPAGG